MNITDQMGNEVDVVTGAVSGGFDPLHQGHLDLINDASRRCDFLIAIVNNDNWLRNKKGYSFYNEYTRRDIITSLKQVDIAFLSSHKEDVEDTSICSELSRLNPDKFFNGGDRDDENTPEIAICQSYDIDMVWNVGGKKKNSSSTLVERAVDKLE